MSPLGTLSFKHGRGLHEVYVSYFGNLSWRASFDNARVLFFVEFVADRSTGLSWIQRLDGSDDIRSARRGSTRLPTSSEAVASLVASLVNEASPDTYGLVELPSDWPW